VVLSFALLVFGGCTNKAPGRLPDAPPAPATSAAYDIATATARVFGSIRFEGKPEELKPVRVGGSRYCVMNKQFISSQDELVTNDGKLQNVMVYVHSGYESRSYTAPSEPVLLDQQRCVYVPHVFTIMTNQKLTIRNSDDTFHNVHAMPTANQVVNLAQPMMGMENTVTFAHPETHFRIGCDLHGWMGAWVGVFDHPFHTTSGDTGTYELRLPPGKYEIAAWHEKCGERRESIEVADNTETN
jgi:plastocyanin